MYVSVWISGWDIKLTSGVFGSEVFEVLEFDGLIFLISGK